MAPVRPSTSTVTPPMRTRSGTVSSRAIGFRSVSSGSSKNPFTVNSDDNDIFRLSPPKKFSGRTYTLKFRSHITARKPIVTKKDTRFRDLLVEFVTIIVTDFNGTETSYEAHKKVLARCSSLYDATFYGAGSLMHEGMNGEYWFGETTHEAFGLMLEFSYKGEFHEDDKFHIDTLIQVGILAERIIAPKLQNEVLRKIEAHCSESNLSAHVLELLFSDNFKESCIPKFLVEFFALTQTLDLADSELPKALLAEVLIAAKDLLKKGGKFSNQR